VCIVCVGPWPLLRHLAPRRPAVVTLAHELDLQLVHLDGDGGRMRRQTDHWVAGATAIRDRLVAHGIPAARIGVAYEFIDAEVPEPGPVAPDRASLGIPERAVVVGACGVMEWRKAPDLFVQLGAVTARLDPSLDVHFVWVGGGYPDLADQLAVDAERAGVGERVHFVGTQSNRWDWYRLFDLFVLPSREDAFPLVCLENALVETPILCFDAGGIPEFVGDDSGQVVAFPDVEAMARAVVDLGRNPSRRAALGVCGARKVRERHTVAVGGPALYAELEPYLR
jgi:glycosyltransferase involved in cell wall biosynthesis